MFRHAVCQRERRPGTHPTTCTRTFAASQATSTALKTGLPLEFVFPESEFLELGQSRFASIQTPNNHLAGKATHALRNQSATTRNQTEPLQTTLRFRQLGQQTGASATLLGSSPQRSRTTHSRLDDRCLALFPPIPQLGQTALAQFHVSQYSSAKALETPSLQRALANTIHRRRAECRGENPTALNLPANDHTLSGVAGSSEVRDAKMCRTEADDSDRLPSRMNRMGREPISAQDVKRPREAFSEFRDSVNSSDAREREHAAPRIAGWHQQADGLVDERDCWGVGALRDSEEEAGTSRLKHVNYEPHRACPGGSWDFALLGVTRNERLSSAESRKPLGQAQWGRLIDD